MQGLTDKTRTMAYNFDNKHKLIICLSACLQDAEFKI
jgi:hypothetical protein